LGLCSYYRRFVAGFASIAAPLHALTRKNAVFRWTEEFDVAFRRLKRSLTTAPILSSPRDDGSYVLDTNASNSGLGVVMSQPRDGEEKVILYASRLLSKAEHNYDITKKELLAVVYGLKQCRQYLFGRRVVVRTDHAALSWLRRTPEPMPQLTRWLTFIQEFSFDVQHRVGTKNQNVDSLPRMPICDESLLDTEQRELRISAVTQQEDVDVADPLAGENFAAEQLSYPDIGPVLRLRANCEAQPPIEALIAESDATKVYWSQWHQLTIHHGVLCRRFYGKGSQSNVLQMIVPATLRSEAMSRCHAGIVGGHLGAKKTVFQVGRRFYWCNSLSRSDFLSSVSCAEIDLRSVVFWDVNRGSQLAFLSSRSCAAAYSRAGARTAWD